jgi:hypothetical protein
MRVKSMTAVALAGAWIFAASHAHAQDAPAPPKPPIVDLYSDDDAQAVLDARLIALKTVIKLTPEQEKLWAPVEAAIRQTTKSAAERREQRGKAPQPATFVDILDRIGDAEATRAQELKVVTAALKPLVASLSEEQRRRIPAFLGMKDGRGAPQPTADLWLFEEEQ